MLWQLHQSVRKGRGEEEEEEQSREGGLTTEAQLLDVFYPLNLLFLCLYFLLVRAMALVPHFSAFLQRYLTSL